MFHSSILLHSLVSHSSKFCFLDRHSHMLHNNCLLHLSMEVLKFLSCLSSIFHHLLGISLEEEVVDQDHHVISVAETIIVLLTVIINHNSPLITQACSGEHLLQSLHGFLLLLGRHIQVPISQGIPCFHKDSPYQSITLQG